MRRQHIAIGISLCFLILSILLVQQNRVAAEGVNERVVTIYDGNREQTLVTTASTVKDALERAKVSVGQHDAVEPRLESKLVAQNYNINVYRARPVVVVDGEQRVNVMSPHKSARQVVESANMSLYPEDGVAIERVDGIESAAIAAQKIVIDRAKPINLVLFGVKTEIRTQAETVGELLNDKGVVLGEQDGMSMPASAPIITGMTLEIWRDGTQTITEEQEVKFSVRQIQDRDREIGFREVKTAGVNGRKIVTYEIEMKNGKEVSRKEVQSVVTSQPTEQIEVVGAKSRGGSPEENRLLGRQMMLAAGFSDDQWPCLDKLWTKESGWNHHADNPSSDAYGIPQALPGNKMGAGWESDPEVQIRWGLGYVKGRYGSPCGAWNAFLSKGWY